MNILFEEEGSFKAASVMADNNTTLQVELPTGKRCKVKAASVLLQFETPRASDLLAAAESEAAAIDAAFLWENCLDGEFGFMELAQDYVGHVPSAIEATSILLCLQSSPVHFHRKGKGRFRRAPPEILQAALAGLEKKRQQQEQIDRMTGELVAGQLPPELSSLLPQLLYKPDRNRPEVKAFEAACGNTGLSAARLLMRCGGLSSAHDYHLGRFLFEYFPQGTGFADIPADVPAGVAEDLPVAPVAAFSIDDAHTTEIDDAFSVVPRAGGGWRIGIHIAAPALGFQPQDALGALARQRLSTVYMPGRKITMLPEAVVDGYTLAAGRTCPAVSVYLDIGSDFTLQARESCVERVPVVANLRHHEIEPLFNEHTLAGTLPELPFRDELKLLWEFAHVLEAGRGKAGQVQNQNDYNFTVDWTQAGSGDDGTESTESTEPGRVCIEQRQRGSPLDKLVSELMIVANSGWARDMADAAVPALYRAQTSGKVRMTTVAAPHEGLGVDCYVWLTSPLRRYADLLNQWQLIAWLQDESPPFSAKSTEFLSALRDFELTYAAYAEFQRGMERYWCLRWMQQEGLADLVLEARVIRDELVRLERLPLVLRLTGLPALVTGCRVRVGIERVELIENEVRATFLGVIEEIPASDPAVVALGEDQSAG